MSAGIQKKNRLLEIFYRAIKGEGISVKELASEYHISTKSISRDINEIKNFLYDSRELVGNTELKYEPGSKCYYLTLDGFLLSKELLAVIKMLIGCRGFGKMELMNLIAKLKRFTSFHDRKLLEKLIAKELYHYNEVHHDCPSVIDRIWQLTRCIDKQVEITITYNKMSREQVKRRIKPIAVLFSEYYYYLIAYRSEDDSWSPIYFRADRIVHITEHRGTFELDDKRRFDEGELRNKIHFMFPGKERHIRFEFTGPSVQAVLDKIPTAKVVEMQGNRKIIEADTYGTGINRFLLLQGSWVKVLEPKELVEEMKEEVRKLREMYEE